MGVGRAGRLCAEAPNPTTAAGEGSLPPPYLGLPITT